MRARRPVFALAIAAGLAACVTPEQPAKEALGRIPHVVTTAEPEWIPFVIRAGRPREADPREKHLGELRQLTFAQGDNVAGAWSPDGKSIAFASTRDGAACEQIYSIDLATGLTRRVSNGQGRTTNAAFVYPHGERLVFSQTSGATCPPKADRSQGYAWALDDFDVFTSKLDGSDKRPLLAGPGYDAETAASFDGSRLVFTSMRDGDPELYTSKADGSDVRRLTNAVGYDGGAAFSPDSTRLVWRANRPSGPALSEYKALLARGIVKAAELEIYVAGSEGQNARAVTRNGKANLAPAFLHDSRRVIFASTVDAPTRPGQPPSFDLYLVDPDAPPASGGVPPLERITFFDGFESSPTFSPDGEYILFASTRHASKPGETNLFVARWLE